MKSKKKLNKQWKKLKTNMVIYRFEENTLRDFVQGVSLEASTKEWLTQRKFAGTVEGKPKYAKVQYLNMPIAYDSETTSAYLDDNGYAIDYDTVQERKAKVKGYNPPKVAYLYVWQLQIGERVMVGRTLEDLVETTNALQTALGLSEDKRIIIWVHNNAFDFQFYRKCFNFTRVFSLDERKPAYACTDSGIEFRCSYILSGYGLATLAKNLTKHKLKKLEGDLDYDKLRHHDTPLTDEELAYCVEDTNIVCAYISEQIEDCGGITKIPLTKTGYVRQYMRERCMGKGPQDKWKRLRYHDFIKSLTLTAEQYEMLKKAFQGGYTHASSIKVPLRLPNGNIIEKIWEDVTSYDFTSSYPFVMLSEMFPMSTFKEYRPKDEEDFRKQMRCYCCLFELTLYDVDTKDGVSDYYISSSHCDVLKGADIANGRVVSAKELKCTITEQDYMVIERCYNWSSFKVRKFHRASKDYLPKDFVLGLLELYKKKTELKGVKGSEAEYQHNKEMANSCYGMTVMDPLQELVLYEEGEWVEKSDPKHKEAQKSTSEALEEYNKSQGRFLYYAWGVWVTAYARRNLWSGILEFGEDFIYADTDSLKVLNIEKHMEYIEKYNKWARKKCEALANYYDIDPEMWRPKTIKGVEKPLGVWDFDGHYKRFKTLGAKRYMVEYSDDPRNGEDKGKVNITVSGLNKKNTVPWLLKSCDGDVESAFHKFNIGLQVPPEATGKRTHTYIDEMQVFKMVDYLGIERECHAPSGVHLEPAAYDMQAEEYIQFLFSIYEEAEA